MLVLDLRATRVVRQRAQIQLLVILISPRPSSVDAVRRLRPYARRIEPTLSPKSDVFSFPVIGKCLHAERADHGGPIPGATAGATPTSSAVALPLAVVAAKDNLRRGLSG